MSKIILLILPMMVLMAAPSSYEQGKNLYFAKGCSGCHGISAGGTNQYPALAYRRKVFLMNKLQNYRSKQGSTQQSQLMIPFAMGLSDKEIDALTTFFSEYHENKSNYKPDLGARGDGGS
ncbi:c-type cytochrome [Sulfuricurvum sp.]|uniref:c-type cytochrome n=1 Tax=Sulfuricurvum sp. TaxID=2025608 RepID=UPI002E378D08|nr:c-type cytochrome [Sulfuricurvum sp.]HEX5329866.1 c-type cytochrome [Sulfuricurvum sp.]